jgi:predicted MFS family arabinose efflux permease
MRNLILVGALALLLLSPLTAVAQQRAAPAPPPPAAAGVSSSKVLAIGIGALLGAVAANAIVAGEGVTLVGGAAGGLLAAWWYDNPEAGPTRAALHAQAEGSEQARGVRLASAQ